MKYLVRNKHWEVNKEYNIDKILYLLIDRPNHITSQEDFIWRREGKLHRGYDLPSICYRDYYILWDKKRKRHRENNKPAKIWYNGYKEYWLRGKRANEMPY